MPSKPRTASARRQVALIGITALTAEFGLLSASVAHADTTASVVYVGATRSAACSDTGATAGAQSAPFCTIQAAIDSPSTGPGTIVLVAAGTYAAQVNVDKSGTAGHPVTIRSASLADGQRAVIEGKSLTANGALAGMVTVAGQHDVVVDGFEVLDGPGAGVSVTGSSNVEVTRSFVVHNATGVTVQNDGAGVTIASDVIVKDWAVGTGVLIDGTSGAAVSGNTIEGNCGFGIALGSGATNTTVENDIVEDNNLLSFYPQQSCPGGVQSAGAQISVADATTTHLDYNVVYPYSSVDPFPPRTNYVVGSEQFSTAAELTAATGLGAHDVVADAKIAATSPLYSPEEGSVPIDSADENAVGESPTDIYGDTAVDDPTMPNTGTGAGVRDRGAVELTRGMPSFIVDVKPVGTTSSVGTPPWTVLVTVDSSRSWYQAASYRYDFGDGSPVEQVSAGQIQHVYNQPGQFTMQVTALDAQGGIIETVSGPTTYVATPVVPVLRLSPEPNDPMTVIADISATTGAANETIDFGDNSGRDTLYPPTRTTTHTYAKPGTYTVTMWASGPAGPTLSTTQQFTATESQGPPPPMDTTPVVHRIAGGDRYATAIAASQARWGTANSIDGLANDKAQAVVLARGDQFPDALAGVPLASYKHGPLLLTDPKTLDTATLKEIQRVIPGDHNHTVYLLGGQNAVSSSIEKELKSLGYNVVRFGGADRFGTALQIAHQGLGDPAHLVLATGDTFADALAAGPYASNGAEVVNGKPAAILLSGMSNGNEAFTDPGTAAYVSSRIAANGGVNCVNPNAITAVGGPAVQAFLSLPAAHDRNRTKFACVDGIVGKDRYATSSQLAGQWGYPEHPAVATGTDFPDALSGGAFAASMGQPLLLTDPLSLPGSTANVLGMMGSDPEATRTRSVIVFGGPGAVSDRVRDQIVSAVHGRFLF